MYALTLTLLCCALLTLTPGTQGFSSGAPDSACDSMIPSHGVAPQDSESPFEILVESDEYSANSTLEVTLHSRSGSEVFLGFLLQALLESPGDGEEFMRVGTFVPDSQVGTRLACEDNRNGALTHTSDHKAAQRSTLTVTWQAPALPAGHIQFRATFVRERVTFWIGVTSAVVYDSTIGRPTGTSPEGTTQAPTPPPTPAPIQEIELGSCGNSKSCYRSPENCEPAANCDIILTWLNTNGGEQVEIEMSGKMGSDQNYLAMGMSRDQLMGDTSVVDCIYDPSQASSKIQMSYNEPRSNAVLSDDQLGLVPGTLKGSVVDGQLVCRFSRFRSVKSFSQASVMDTDKVFDLDQDHYLFVAKGPVVSGFKLRHQEIPAITTETVNMTSSVRVNLGGTQSFPLVKAHGIVMVIAWMVCASFGVLMPRYMKTAWPGKTACGKQIWFQIHQPMMILTFLLTISGFVIIFTEVKGYSMLEGATSAHPPLGIIVTACVIINPLMSLFRCAPDHPRRVVFNICHFLVGELGHILSAATIFLGLYMSKAGLPDWCRWVMVAYIVWHALCEIALAIHMHILRRSQEKSTTSNITLQGFNVKPAGKSDPSKMEMTEVNGSSAKMVSDSSTDISKNDSGSGFKTGVAVLHLLGVLGLAITLSVQIGLA